MSSSGEEIEGAVKSGLLRTYFSGSSQGVFPICISVPAETTYPSTKTLYGISWGTSSFSSRASNASLYISLQPFIDTTAQYHLLWDASHNEANPPWLKPIN